jgi:Recombination endonuclease VII
MRTASWTCRRVSKSVVCGHRNAPRAKKCEACGKLRPAKRSPAHMRVLADFDYAYFVALNDGEHCGICGAERPPNRLLDRDHSHRKGERIPRGLLCRKCNRTLQDVRFGQVVTPEWLRAAADYLDRAQQRTVSEGNR